MGSSILYVIWPFVMMRGEGGAIKWWNVGVIARQLLIKCGVNEIERH